MRRLMFMAGMLALLVAVPTAAHAQAYVAPFIGFDVGGDAGKCPPATGAGCSHNRMNYGFGLGVLKHGTIGAEIDFGYAPTFFGDSPAIGSNSVITFMGNIVVAIPAGPIHPYVTGGLGLIHSKADQVFAVSGFSESNFAYNLGGGLMVMLPAHVGFRIDYRYMATAGDVSAAGQPLLSTGTTLNFSRFAFAIVIH